MRRLFYAAAVTLGLAVLLAAPFASASIFDGSKEAACQGAALDSSATCDSLTAGSKDPNATIKTALNIFSAIVGLIAVIMIIFAGLRYMLSGGDSSKTAAAQNTAIYALIGLVVAALAQVIVKFVLKKFTK